MVDKHPHQVVSKALAIMLPPPAYRLSFAGDGPELLFEFQQHIGDQVVRNRLAVIKPEWQQELEPSKRGAHCSIAART